MTSSSYGLTNMPFGQMAISKGTDEQKKEIQEALQNADWNSVFDECKDDLSTENIAKTVLNSDDEEMKEILSQVLQDYNAGEDSFKNKNDLLKMDKSERDYLTKKYGTLEDGKYTYEIGGKTYSVKQSKSEQVSDLRNSFSDLRKQDGVISTVTGWVKNLFGAKSSPKYVEDKISALEEKIKSGKTVTQSEINEVKELINNYSARSEDGSTALSAVAGFGVGATCGAAIGTALFPGLGTVIGGFLGSIVGGFFAGSATKVVAEQIDNFTDQTDGNELQLSEMLEDALQGGTTGAVAGAAGHSAMGKYGSQKASSGLLNMAKAAYTTAENSVDMKADYNKNDKNRKKT